MNVSVKFLGFFEFDLHSKEANYTSLLRSFHISISRSHQMALSLYL